MKSVGQHFELEESYGNFKGVGGKVEVKGKRNPDAQHEDTG